MLVCIESCPSLELCIAQESSFFFYIVGNLFLSVQFLYIEQGSCKAEVMFDFSYLHDFTIILPHDSDGE